MYAAHQCGRGNAPRQEDTLGDFLVDGGRGQHAEAEAAHGELLDLPIRIDFDGGFEGCADFFRRRFDELTQTMRGPRKDQWKPDRRFQAYGPAWRDALHAGTSE